MEEILQAFKSHDLNGDGVISREEFEALMGNLGPAYGTVSWTREQFDTLYAAADADRNGVIDIEEFLQFIFSDDVGETKVTEDEAVAATVPGDSSESSDGSSSSSSESGSDEMGGTASAAVRKFGRDKAETASTRVRRRSHLTRKITRCRKHEEPLTTSEEMYELLTTDGGTITGLLKLQCLVTLFANCKRAKLGPMLARLVPQDCHPDTIAEAAEDVSPMELGHLYAMLEEVPEATWKDAVETIVSVKDVTRTMETDDVATVGLDPNASVGFGIFQRLLGFLAAAMHVDQAHILAAMAWARTGRFEMTEALAVAVMEKVFLSAARPDEHLLERPITSNDFLRMCYAVGFIDATGTGSQNTGPGRAHLEIMFENTVRHLPRRRLERERKRRDPLGKKPRKRHHTHKGIMGRTELSILMEELFKARPPNMYASPLHLVLALMDGQSGQRERFR